MFAFFPLKRALVAAALAAGMACGGASPASAWMLFGFNDPPPARRPIIRRAPLTAAAMS